MWKQFVNWRYIILYPFRIPFITIQNCGPTRRTIIPLRERPCLIIKKQNYPPTGAHHSLRSASLWRSAIKLIRSSSTNKPTPYTPWSLTETTVRRHWVVTPRRGWLANRHRCREIVTGKVSILIPIIAKQEVGIISNQENNCDTCDSRIGFGTGGHDGDDNTCGNWARYGGDNGNRDIKAMGYILVQWVSNNLLPVHAARWLMEFTTFIQIGDLSVRNNNYCLGQDDL